MELVIQNLSKTYANGTRALDNVSLNIPRGMFGLLGQNGAGKSTFMRTLATLQEADSGSAHLDGLDVLREKDAVRRILGYLPQEFGVYPKLSALAMLDHLAVLKGIAHNGERKALVEALLQKTNLWEHRKKAVSSYSGGMRQRFGIAQALIGSPKLIIVDEPTAGLDPAERVRFRHLLASTEARVSVISTHIVEDVTAVAPQVSVLVGGELKYQGAPHGLREYAEGRVYVGNDLSGTVVQLTDAGPRVLTPASLPGLVACPPTVEEGYLALAGRSA